MRVRSAIWLVLLAIGCGGQTGEAESPEPASEDEVLESVERTGESSEPGAAPGLKASAAQTEPTGDDVSSILQLVIEDPELDPYLKLGEPGRFPLKLHGEKVPGGVKLIKGAEPVQIVDAPKTSKDPVLVVTELDLEGTTATVRYQYGAEGIRGTARLNKTSHGWELKSSRIVEHKSSDNAITPGGAK